MSRPISRARKPSNLPRKRPGPEGGKRDRNRRDNQRRLAEAALELFLARGIAAVTIDDIVDAAGMAKGSFYRYARDKADLVAQIVAPVVDEVTGALDRCEHALHQARRATLAPIYTQLATDLAVVVARDAPRVLLYLQEARAPAAPARRTIHALADRLAARTVVLTEIARDHGLIRRVDPEVAALTVLGAIDALLFVRLRRRAPPTDAPTVIAELVSIVLGGVRQPAPPIDRAGAR